MPLSSPAEAVRLLLDEMERTEPISYDLGTPQLFETPEVQRLVALGSHGVPHIVEAMNETGSSKRKAYAAMALGLIGDSRALAPLRNACELHQTRERKDIWDYALIAQCSEAIARLSLTKE